MVERSSTPNRALVPVSQEVTSYRQAISPHRDVLRGARSILNQFRALDNDRATFDAIRQEALEEGTTDSGVEVISTWRAELDQRFQQLGGVEARSKAEETRRTALNEIIRARNQLRATRAVNEGLVAPTAISLVGEPQIQRLRPNISVSEPSSPTLPHNDLGEAAIFSERRLDSNLKQAVIRYSSSIHSSDREKAQTALAVSLLLPKQIREFKFGSTPQFFKDSSQVAAGLVALTQKIEAFEQGRITVPSMLEIGKAGPEQSAHIARAVTVILLNCLAVELRDPNMNEDELRKHYQTQVSKNLRDMVANWVGGRKGYEEVVKAIESLPDVEYAMLCSRLSTNLDQDLCFVGAPFASERKFAECLRNASSTPINDDKLKHPSYFTRKELVGKLIEVLEDRVNDDEINLRDVFGEIESLDYGEHVIRRIFEAADPDGQEIFLEAVYLSGCFRDLHNQILDEEHEGQLDNPYKRPFRRTG